MLLNNPGKNRYVSPRIFVDKDININHFYLICLGTALYARYPAGSIKQKSICFLRQDNVGEKLLRT